MVKADPAAGAARDVAFEGFLGHWGPAIRRIVELNKQLVLRQEGIVDGIGIGDVVDGKVIFIGQLLQPYLGRSYELIVWSVPRLCDRHHPKLDRVIWSIQSMRCDSCECNHEKRKRLQRQVL